MSKIKPTVVSCVIIFCYDMLTAIKSLISFEFRMIIGNIGIFSGIVSTLMVFWFFQVVWMDQYDNVLYYDTNRIIDNDNFELMRPGDGNMWNLRISQLAVKDEGRYRCIENSNPMQIQFFDLIVNG